MPVKPWVSLNDLDLREGSPVEHCVAWSCLGTRSKKAAEAPVLPQPLVAYDISKQIWPNIHHFCAILGLSTSLIRIIPPFWSILHVIYL